MNGLRDSRVVILGGTSGIGLATARAAGQAGAAVVVGGRDSDRLGRALDLLGPTAEGHVVDVDDASSIERFFDATGSLDHLLVTPSRLIPVPVSETTEEQVRPALDLRFWAAFHASRLAAPRMAESGSITFTSGIAGSRPIPNEAVAGASCAAVEALMRSLVTELAPVRCNVLCPGYVDTPLLDDFLGASRDSKVAAIAESLPGKRIGRPEEIADAALFLMGNGYMNGHVLTIDGAHTLV
ncbi:SDR family oxidoreductase [Saccharopolyspora sp. NPDC050389]|uniref:SDR family oxidoreductase n=1 Tax=Saccharopolyspora sp. NPDC050389 TaxID=3155516 RepID=UPI0033E69204